MRDLARSPLPASRTLAFYVVWLISGVLSSLATGTGHVVPIMLATEIADGSFTFIWVCVARPSVFRLYTRTGSWMWLALSIVTAWPIAFAIHAFAMLVTWAFALPVQNLSSTFAIEGYGWVPLLVAVCLQPPVVEELAFRGYLYTTLADSMKPRDAILVTAFAFSIMHFSLVVFLPFAILGAYFGWLRWRSGSLWPPMIAHCLHNLLVSLEDGGINVLPM